VYFLDDELDFDYNDYSVDGISELGFDHEEHFLSDPDFSELNFNDYSIDEPELILDVPYVPTSEDIVHAMLDLARVTSKDVLYDLGCGDGRIVVAAALERNTRGFGIDMDPERISEAMEYAGNTGVEFLVDFFEGDLLDADFSDATVVALYLLDSVNVQLRPRLLDELRPGTRIVSHAFDMGGWIPDTTRRHGSTQLYKWIVPAKVAAFWEWQTTSGKTYRAELNQKYQEVTGAAWIDGEKAQLTKASLRGDLLKLIIQGNDPDSKPASFVMRHEGTQMVSAKGNRQATPAIRLPNGHLQDTHDL